MSKRTRLFASAIGLIACLAAAATLLACGQERDAGQITPPAPDVRSPDHRHSNPPAGGQGDHRARSKPHNDAYAHTFASPHIEAAAYRHADRNTHTHARPNSYA